MQSGEHYPFYDSESRKAFEELIVDLRRFRGIAVTGAGTSSPLPSWPDLYECLRTRVGKKRLPPYNPASGTELPDLFTHAVDQLGSASVLTHLKSILKVDQNLYPGILHALASCSAFGTLYTFNFDEYLFILGKHFERSVRWYPDLTFSSQDYPHPFLYLHGRLETAKTCDDLVLTRTSYANAYGTNERLTDIIRHDFFATPVVFVGTSLTDHPFRNVLEQLGRLAGDRSPDGTEIRRRPGMWYAFMPALGATPQEKHDNVKLARIRLEATGIRGIWYEVDGNDHTALSDCLVQLNEQVTVPSMPSSSTTSANLLRASVAARLARIERPSPSHFNRARELFGNPVARKAFFESCQSPDWLPFLDENDYLIPPPVQQLDDGALAAPPWYASLYLQRIATSRPDFILEFLQKTSTNNWLALVAFTKLAAQLPPKYVPHLAERAQLWLHAPGAPSEVVEGLLDALQQWQAMGSHRDNDTRPIAQLLLEYLATPQRGAMFFDVCRTRLTTLLCERRTDQLIFWETVRGTLQRFAQDSWETPSNDRSWILRPKLEEPDALDHGDPIDWLIDCGTSLLRSSRRRAGYSTAISAAFHAEWPLIRRFALLEAYHSKKAFQAIQRDLAQRLTELMNDMPVFHELGLILASTRRHHSNVRQAALGVIQSNRLDPAIQQQWAALLTGSKKRANDSLFDPSVVMQKPHVFVPSAPLTYEEFVEIASGLSDSSVLELLRNPESFGIKISILHSTDALWELASQYIEQSGRIEILELALVSGWNEFAWKMFGAVAKWTERNGNNWSDYLRLVRIGATSTNRLAAWASLQSLHSVSEDLLTTPYFESAIEVATSVLTATYTDPDTAVALSRYLQGEDKQDLLHHQFNEVPGLAAQTIYNLAVRQIVAGRDGEPVLPSWLRELFRKCMSEGWGGMEFLIVAGNLLPNILRDERDSLIELLRSAFSGDRPGDLLRQECILTGYALSIQPDRYTLSVIAPFLTRVIVAAPDIFPDRIFQRLSSHLNLGVFHEVSGFEKAWEEILDHGTTRSIKAIVSSACRMLPDNPTTDDKMYRKVAELLELHTQTASKRSQNALSEWALWIKKLIKGIRISNVSVPLSQVIRNVGGWEVFHVFEFLEGTARNEPEWTRNIVEDCLERWCSLPEARWSRRKLLSLLEALSASLPAVELQPAVEKFLAAGLLELNEARQLLHLGD